MLWVWIPAVCRKGWQREIVQCVKDMVSTEPQYSLEGGERRHLRSGWFALRFQQANCAKHLKAALAGTPRYQDWKFHLSAVPPVVSLWLGNLRTDINAAGLLGILGELHGLECVPGTVVLRKDHRFRCARRVDGRPRPCPRRGRVATI